MRSLERLGLTLLNARSSLSSDGNSSQSSRRNFWGLELGQGLDNIVISATVVISSKGLSAQHKGGVLGQYEYIEDKGYYKQTSEEQKVQEICELAFQEEKPSGILDAIAIGFAKSYAIAFCLRLIHREGINLSSIEGVPDDLYDKFDEFERKFVGEQSSTEQSHKKFVSTYLYRDEDDEWWVGSTPGKKAGLLWNPRPSTTPPRDGWLLRDGHRSWTPDATLTVRPGPLLLPRQFTVNVTGAAAERCPSCLGVYSSKPKDKKHDPMWWNGRPVFQCFHNEEEEEMFSFLYHSGGREGWVIGSKLGKYALTGPSPSGPFRPSNPNSPDSPNRWHYWTGSSHKPASVTVTVSD